MRILLSLGAAALLAAVVLTAVPSETSAAGATTSSTTVTVSAPAGRSVDGGTLAPQFFGKLWKKIKKIIEKIIKVIDFIDATINPGGGGGGSGKTIGAFDPTNVSPTRPEWRLLSPIPGPVGVA